MKPARLGEAKQSLSHWPSGSAPRSPPHPHLEYLSRRRSLSPSRDAGHLSPQPSGFVPLRRGSGCVVGLSSAPLLSPIRFSPSPAAPAAAKESCLQERHSSRSDFAPPT